MGYGEATIYLKGYDRKRLLQQLVDVLLLDILI